MFKTFGAAATLASLLITTTGFAAPLMEGRSTYLHSHRHAHHHHAMVHSYGARHGMSYGVGSHPPRTTATGGNPGGYSTRN